MGRRSVVGLIGAPEAGKDTVAKMLADYAGWNHLSFALALREEMAKAFGISAQVVFSRDFKDSRQPALTANSCLDRNFAKLLNPELIYTGRELLQLYGTEYRRNEDEDYWVKAVRDLLTDKIPDSNAVISDVRFANEAAICTELWLVVRPGHYPVGYDANHSSELWWPSVTPNRTITNTTLLDTLRQVLDIVNPQVSTVAVQDWREKIERAKSARDMAIQARNGRTPVFPTRQWMPE